jgi:myo-inositol-1(or 4)-monophosphatase
MDKVEEFFHYISPKIIALTNQRFEHTREITYKQENTPDFVTEGDLDNEELIKKELFNWFPEDQIIAEETLSDSSQINKGRNWIIDPICGSANFKNGVKFFSTNIALSQDGHLIASCVIDHSREEYIWSTGNNTIHIGNQITKSAQRSLGVVVEVDLSAVMGVPKEITERQEKLVANLLNNKKYYLASFNTSLGFAYSALGRINAYASGYNRVWDVAAANFLIIQAGGIVTQMDGKPWTLTSDNVLASIDINLHKELLKILTT